MPKTNKTFRVLLVDDNRDGADSLGLLLEALGCKVHVTYGGAQALQVAAAFRPDLMLVDLVMPDMDGCGLVTQLRQIPAFARTKIVALTGYKEEERKSSAMEAGFDAVLFKPPALTDIEAVLANVGVADAAQLPRRAKERASLGAEQRLPIDEARRIRNKRKSGALTQAECEAAICDGIVRFQDEYLGWRSQQIHAHLIKDLLVVRVRNALTLAEQQLGNSASPETGRDLIKATRKQLLEVARSMLESLIHEILGVKVSSMHHDLSTVTGEEMIIFSLVGEPCFG